MSVCVIWWGFFGADKWDDIFGGKNGEHRELRGKYHEMEKIRDLSPDRYITG